MPNGEDELIAQQSTGINLMEPRFQEEIEVTLTKAEALFIHQILEANIAPRGREMVEFAYKLLNRFKDVPTWLTPEDTGSAPTEDAFAQPKATVEEVTTTVTESNTNVINNIGSTVPKEE